MQLDVGFRPFGPGCPNRDSIDVTNTEQIEARVNEAAEGELDFLLIGRAPQTLRGSQTVVGTWWERGT
jgi:hypothetical protein